MLQIFRNPSYDFMRLKLVGLVLSTLVIGASLFEVWQHYHRTGDLLNYGIDFRGGTLMQVRFAERPDLARLRDGLKAAGFGNAAIQAYGPAEENSVLIRVSEQLEESRDLVAMIRGAIRPADERAQDEQQLLDLNTSGENDLAERLEQAITGSVSASPDPRFMAAARAIVARRGQQPDGMLDSVADVRALPAVTPDIAEALDRIAYTGSLAFLRTESVGPSVGRELRAKAFLASLVACGVILIYLWFRFELRFGVAAVLCLVHDAMFIVGVFALTDREFDLTVLAAVLTVIGYSVNDTIVIFDRVRSNLKVMRKESLSAVLNTAINQTLSRTVLTSGMTLLVVIALFLYGGEVLNNFAFALLVGILVGSYSTIFVASPLVLVWQRLFKNA